MSAQVVVVASPPPWSHLFETTPQQVQFGSTGAVANITWHRTPSGVRHGAVEIVMKNGESTTLDADKVRVDEA